MKRFFLVLSCFFLSISLVFAEINIAEEHRIENIDPGYCAWAALETLGRHHRIPALYNLTKNRTKEWDFEKKKGREVYRYKWIDYGNHKEAEKVNVGSFRAIANKLNSLGVKFRMHNGYDTSLIRYAMRNNLGCVIACKAEGFYMDPPGEHAVLLIQFEDDKVSFIDSNDAYNVYRANMAWFNKYWVGYTIVVEK